MLLYILILILGVLTGLVSLCPDECFEAIYQQEKAGQHDEADGHHNLTIKNSDISNNHQDIRGFSGNNLLIQKDTFDHYALSY